MHPRPLPVGNATTRVTPPTWFLPGMGAVQLPIPWVTCALESSSLPLNFLIILVVCTFTHLVGLPFLDDFTSYMTWHLHRIYIALAHSLTLLP